MIRPDMRDLIPDLRRIGFDRWDPLGLAGEVADGAAIADEYDSDLMQALGMAINGSDRGSVDAVLRAAEVRMGLDDGGDAQVRRRVATDLMALAQRYTARS